MNDVANNVMTTVTTRKPTRKRVIRSSRVAEGLPEPLGATWDGLGVNFALFSANATRVDLCIFDAKGQKELERIPLPEYTDEVWHAYLPDARPGTVYGYRVYGPHEPEKGHRFNPNKLVLDPYAKALVGELKWSDELFAYQVGGENPDLTFDDRDSAPFMPKCRVVDPAFTWGRERAPKIAWDRTIIYEAHVRGYTIRHPAVSPELRGTFAGLAVRDVVQYIRSLGVTAIELLPVQASIADRHLMEKELANYWGYHTLAFFAPNPRYCATGRVVEFKEMVARLHDAGIEVILDVVYNHTPEGNELGPTLCFKGIDNASYYRLFPDQQRHYINDTGTGNTLNVSHPRVLQLVTDSLRYWITEMHVDGFRFDLATILARETHGFDQGGGFLDSCRQDPLLSKVKLIAEPWDIGPGGYQVGQFPPGWAEWNDKFRDTVRSYWKGDEGRAPDLATRMTASGDLFNGRGRKPWASVNFVTAHDGFTLHDLVSYNDKHNEANKEDNRDGHTNNLSWNCGAEGETDDPNIRVLRERQKRNLIATLMFAQGTPMLLAGDEFGNTQYGNNNAYCQDNDITWLDWEVRSDDDQRLTRYVNRVIALRHAYPILRRSRFLVGAYNKELDVKDVTWIDARGVEKSEESWRDSAERCFGIILDGRAQTSGIRRPGSDETLLLILNAHHEVVLFTLPVVAGGNEWKCLLDTDVPERSEQRVFVFGEKYPVAGRSLLLFVLHHHVKAAEN